MSLTLFPQALKKVCLGEEYGLLVEVLCQVGKSSKAQPDKEVHAGSDTRASAEAISRLISRSLQQTRTREDREDMIKTLAKTLRGIIGKTSGFHRGIFLQSISDALAWVLQDGPDKDGKKTLKAIKIKR